MEWIRRRRHLTARTACSVLLTAFLLCSRGFCATPLPFDLPPGPASETLNEYGHQAGLFVYFQFDIVKGVNTPAVQGTLDPAVALTRLLAGSGLLFRPVTERTLIVYRDESRSKKPSSGALSSGVARIQEIWRKLTTAPDPAQVTEEVIIAQDRNHDDLERPAGAQSVVITSGDMTRAGVTTAAEALNTLPFNFRGGANENTTFGREARSNTAFGSGANLYGLGSRATLVLVNGQRLAPSGSSGFFVDISSIPLSAVDHVEVLDDSTAALYGADAIGGVINYVLRKDAHWIESTADLGHLFHGALGQQSFSQTLSHGWETGSGFLAVEFYERDALFASQRRQATSDLKPWGGPDLGTFAGSPGTIIDAAGNVWGIPKGQNGVGLKPADLLAGVPNVYDLYQDSTILPHQRRVSAYGSLTQHLSDDASVEFSALYSRRHFESQTAPLTALLTVPSTNPYHVLPDNYVGTSDDGGAVMVDYGFGNDLGPLKLKGRVDTGQFVLGYSYRPFHAWGVESDIGYALENQHDEEDGLVDFSKLQTALNQTEADLAFNAFGAGKDNSDAILAPIRSTGYVRYHSSLTYGTVKASGPLFTFWDSAIALTVGLDYRLQSLSSKINPSELVPAPETDRKRRIGAAFTELNIPLWSPKTGGGRQDRLTLSLGGRYEHYSDVGRVFTPQVGLSFKPGGGFSVHGSWVRLFRAPSLADLTESNNISGLYPLADPRSPTGYTTALIWSGNNANLRPETAKSWSFGTTFSPEAVPSLALALTYFDFVFNNRVQEITDLPLNVLSDLDYSWLVTRGVSAAQQTDVCNRTQYRGVQSDCTTANVGALVDIRLHNSQRLETNGIDFSTRYRFPMPVGEITYGLDSTYVLRYALANTPTDPLDDVRNSPHNPPGLKLRNNLAWDYRGLGIATFLNYQNGYRDPSTARRVSSWTTVDATVGFALPDGGSRSKGQTQIVLRGSNIFNRDPPVLIDLIGLGYDHENADLYGRRFSLRLQRRW